MSVKLPCGCQDTKMCAEHDAQWWARHAEALARQAAQSNPRAVAPAVDSEWLNN